MNDNAYNTFWKLTGKPRPGGFDETYPRLLGEYTRAQQSIISTGAPDAEAKLAALEEAFAAIGGPMRHEEYAATRFASSLISPEKLNTQTGGGTRIVGAWRSTRESIAGAFGKLKARLTRPSAATAMGEPKALPLVGLASGAPLEPILDGKTHIRITAEQIPTPVPLEPVNVSKAKKTTSETVRAASAEKLAAAKAAQAERQMARAGRSEQMRVASAAELDAAKAAYDAELAGRPVRQEAAHAATAEKQVAAQAAQAEAAASKAARVAAAEKTARASFQAPKGSIGQRLSANTANFAERAAMPIVRRFSTKDPYKILGITPHTSQTAAMAAFEAKLSALGDMRMSSPKAQLEWQRLHDAYEAVYENLRERPKFTPPAIPVPERTSKIGAALDRAGEFTSGLFGKMKGWVSRKPAVEAAMAEGEPTADAAIKLLAGPSEAGAETAATTANLPILHPTATNKRSSGFSGSGAANSTASTAAGGIPEAEFSKVKLIAGPVYSSAELNGGRRISYLSNAAEHSPLRGKLLLAGGVVAAAAIGYFGNRKQEKYPMPPMPPIPRPRAASWAEATQQPAATSELLR